MSYGDEVTALAKNEVLCISEIEAHVKYYYNIIKIVMLIPSKDLLDDMFVNQHNIIYYVFY